LVASDDASGAAKVDDADLVMLEKKIAEAIARKTAALSAALSVQVYSQGVCELAEHCTVMHDRTSVFTDRVRAALGKFVAVTTQNTGGSSSSQPNHPHPREYGEQLEASVQDIGRIFEEMADQVAGELHRKGLASLKRAKLALSQAIPELVESTKASAASPLSSSSSSSASSSLTSYSSSSSSSAPSFSSRPSSLFPFTPPLSSSSSGLSSYSSPSSWLRLPALSNTPRLAPEPPTEPTEPGEGQGDGQGDGPGQGEEEDGDDESVLGFQQRRRRKSQRGRSGRRAPIIPCDDDEL
jgi:hypothetical protein